MIEISVTVESIEQAKELVILDIDSLYFGDEAFGLRLPRHFSREELQELVQLAHAHNKKARVAVNAIMHPEKMVHIPDYLSFLEEIGVDEIVVGDPGVIYVILRDQINLPFIYDAATMVTSSRQINFWAKRGAIGAVLAREIPFEELQLLSENTTVFGEVLVYGPTCIHHSKRPLVDNYFSYTGLKEEASKERGLFISEPKEENTHYSIYEDQHGTHIFATDDVSLMSEVNQLTTAGLTHWKLDGIYIPSEIYVAVVACFIEAKQLIEAGEWSDVHQKRLAQEVANLHPASRSLSTGFYYLNPDEIR